MAFIFIILLVVILLPDFYIWQFLVRHSAPIWVNVAYWIPSASALAALTAALMGRYHDWTMKLFMTVLLCLAIPKLLFTVINLLGKVFSTFYSKGDTISLWIGGGMAILTCLAFIYGLTFGWKRLVLDNQTISFETLPPAFDGYRIVQISDLHVGTYGSDSRFLQQIVDNTNKLHPDVILFTGDIVNISADELKPFKQVLSQLKARDGIFSVLGNHDYCLYGNLQKAEIKENVLEIIQQQKDFGWNLLLNEHRIIKRGSDSLAIIGVENIGKPPFHSEGDLKKALGALPDETFKILLSHDPTHWQREVVPQTNIPLTFSGHTHAMQLQIGSFSPSSWLFKEWGGLYEEGKQKLFVSLGIGGTVPFRLGAWPEINLIELKQKNEPMASTQTMKLNLKK